MPAPSAATSPTAPPSATRRRPLIALGATLVLRKGEAQRRLPLEDFFLDYGKQDLRPGEFVEAVALPCPAPAQFNCYKLAKRFDQDISAVCGGICTSTPGGPVDAPASLWRHGRHPEAGEQPRARLGAALERGTIAAPCRPCTGLQPISDMAGEPEYRHLSRRTCCSASSSRDRATTPVRGWLGGSGPMSAGNRRGRPRCVPAAACHDSARKHVTGEARYIDDMPEPAGLLHVYVGLSGLRHAG